MTPVAAFLHQYQVELFVLIFGGWITAIVIAYHKRGVGTDHHIGG
ncbi:MAG: hypothetical protein ACREHG_03470 [Candidatus Saccharimonadales bacterium]